MSTKSKRCSMALLGITMITATAQATSYSITEIGTLGYVPTVDGVYTDLRALNNNGEIVGRSLTAEGQEHAFLYSNGIMKDLGTLGGNKSIALSINDHGDVVGGSYISLNEYRAFLFSNGTMQDLGTLGGTASRATGISNSGLIVGSANTVDNESHTFLYSNGTMQDIGAFGVSGVPKVNTVGEVSGTVYLSGSYQAFLYTNGQIRNLGNFGDRSFAHDLNDRGQVVGASAPTPLNSPEMAFIYSDDHIQALGNLQGVDPALTYYSVANGINNLGQVVGTANNGVGDSRAFLYSEGIMMDLNTLILDSGWQLDQAYDINDVGQIIGIGSHNNVPSPFLLTPGEGPSGFPLEATPVPEPSAVLLLASTLMTMLLVLRKAHYI